MSNLSKSHVRFRRNEHGTVAIVFALVAVVLCGCVAFAIDIARLYNLSSKMIVALDSAALAAAKQMQDDDASDSDLMATAQSYFNAQMAKLSISGVTLSPLAVVADRAQSSVVASINATFPTTFARAMGVNEISMPRSSTVVFKMKKIELALALDITGSMNDTPAGDSTTKIASLRSAAKEIVDQLFDQAINDNIIRIALAPYSASVNPGSYANAATGGAASSGCVVERSGTENATDSGPGGSASLVPLASTSQASNTCPTAAVIPLSGRNKRNDLKAAIDAYETGGWTAGHLGTAWGWYLVSPSWASLFPTKNRPAAYSASGDVVKNVVIMTDGLFNTAYLSGYDPDSAGAIDEAFTQFANLCANMKAKNIKVYTVLLDVSDPRAETELRNCASGPANFFATNNGEQLRAAFRDIAAKLSALRVAR